MLYITNLAHGIDAYSLPALEHVKQYNHRGQTNAIRQLAVVHGSQRLLLSGDGQALLFNLNTAKIEQNLQHGCVLSLLAQSQTILTNCRQSDETPLSIAVCSFIEAYSSLISD